MLKPIARITCISDIGYKKNVQKHLSCTFLFNLNLYKATLISTQQLQFELIKNNYFTELFPGDRAFSGVFVFLKRASSLVLSFFLSLTFMISKSKRLLFLTLSAPIATNFLPF